jgi:hypothetical protein
MIYPTDEIMVMHNRSKASGFQTQNLQKSVNRSVLTTSPAVYYGYIPIAAKDESFGG